MKADEPATRLWEAYWNNRENPAHLEALIKHYWPLLERCVCEYIAAHEERVGDRDDILSEAAETLAKMIPRYQQQEGISLVSWVKAVARSAARLAGLRFARQAGCRGVLNVAGERATVLSLDDLRKTADSKGEIERRLAVSNETFMRANPERLAIERESEEHVFEILKALALRLDKLNLPGEKILADAWQGKAWLAIEAEHGVPGLRSIVQALFVEVNKRAKHPIDVSEPRPIRTLADAMASLGVDGKLFCELRAEGRSLAEIAETYFGFRSEEPLRRTIHRAEAMLRTDVKQQREEARAVAA